MAKAKHSRLLPLAAILAAVLPGFASMTWAASLDRIERRGVFEVCVNPDAMPYSSLLEGERGLHLDLARAFASKLGVDAKFSWVAYRFHAKYTRCDAFMGVGVLEGEEEGFVKKTTPYLRYQTLLVTKPGKSITKLEDLDGLRVATQSGSLAHVTLLKRPVDVRVSLLEDHIVLDAIDKGDIDVGVVSNIGLQWYLKNNPDKKFSTSSASTVQDITEYPIAIGLRKADAKLVAAANKAIEQLVATGEMKKILGQYGLENAQNNKSD